MKKRTGIIIAIILVVAAILGVTQYKGKDNTKANSDVETAKHQDGDIITVTDRNGEVEVAYNPKNVVVLDFASLDIMDDLGIEPVALPKASIPSYLEKYKDDKYIDLGSLKSYDMEAVAAAQPDLIIIEGRQEEAIAEFQKLAPTLYLGSDGDYFASLERTARVLGQIFGKEAEVEEKLASINARKEELASKTKALNATALFLMVNEGSYGAQGADSRFGYVYNEFGFTPIDTNIDDATHGQEVTNEYIKEKNPDFLIVLDRTYATGSGEGKATAQETLDNDLIKSTDAYKNGHIIYVEPTAWYIGGPGFKGADVVLRDMENAVK